MLLNRTYRRIFSIAVIGGAYALSDDPPVTSPAFRATTTASTSGPTGSASGVPAPQPEWAHPSPYDQSVPADRFADTRHLCTLRAHWDLPRIMAQWQAGGEETWPWVWCQRNPTGPHFVFVGFTAGSLDQVRAVAAASSANNITVVLAKGGDELAAVGVSEAQLHALGCAIIHEPVAQIDAGAKLLMLRDERILAYDKAFLS